MKLVIDRSIAFMDADYNSRVAGKKVVTLLTCADSDIDTCRPALDMFKKTFDLLKLDYIGSVEALGCETEGAIKDIYKEKTRTLVESSYEHQRTPLLCNEEGR